jgi:hypothetical protein
LQKIEKKLTENFTSLKLISSTALHLKPVAKLKRNFEKEHLENFTSLKKHFINMFYEILSQSVKLKEILQRN